jgi:outer membrane protein assembly factor BamA
VTSYAPASPLSRSATPPRVTYGRGFLDLRRYNRVAPDAQLNFRVALGGWLHGDELPLERRFSVGGAGTLPGFDFRRSVGSEDVGTCAAGATPEGTPAQCERMALAQVEYRGDLRVRVFSDIDDEDDRRPRWRRLGYRTDVTWVAFADAGRGWLVGPRVGTLQYPSGSFPTIDTFRSDVGVGLDLGVVGVYVAKAVSRAKEPANVFVRVRHRF